MTVDEFRAKLRYRIEHPKCKRCGKEFYIPQPPQELFESWGICRKQKSPVEGVTELNSLIEQAAD